MVLIGSNTWRGRRRYPNRTAITTTPAPATTFPADAFPTAPENFSAPKIRFSTRSFIDEDGFKIKARAISRDNGLTWERYTGPEQVEEKAAAEDQTPWTSWADEVEGETKALEKGSTKKEEKPPAAAEKIQRDKYGRPLPEIEWDFS